MHIHAAPIVRVSVALFVSLILPSRAVLADDSASIPQTHDSLIHNIQVCKTNGDYAGAFNSELLAIQLDPTNSDTAADCLQTLVQNTPATFSVSTLTATPIGSLPFDVITSKTEAGLLKCDDQTVLLVPHDAMPVEEDDPVESWPFGRAMYVYSTNGGDLATLICSVHYETSDTTALSERIGNLLALLDKIYADRMQISRADDGYPFHVWLCATAPVSNGGEQWRNNIYFYDVADSRSSIEWIREIAHEFSHLAFPAVGGAYTNPEAFANGYLGERLLVRWISRGTDGGAASAEAAWKGTFAGYYNFNRLLIGPPLKDFSEYGISRERLGRRDADGMRYLIGMLLTLDDRCGSAAVGMVLQGLADQHSSDPNLLYDPVHALLSQKAETNLKQE